MDDQITYEDEIEGLENQLEQLKDKQKKNLKKTELQREIKKIKRGPLMKILHEIKNGSKLFFKGFIFLIKSLFQVIEKSKHNYESYGKPPEKKAQDKKLREIEKKKSSNGVKVDATDLSLLEGFGDLV